jgi:hypothetical protein
MLNYHKYLKYKNKYLNLKKLLGGKTLVLDKEDYKIYEYKNNLPATDEYYETILDFGEPFYDRNSLKEYFEALVTTNDCDTYIFLYKDVPIGFSLISNNPEKCVDDQCFNCKKKCLYVILLCIQQEYRGKHHLQKIANLLYSIFKEKGLNCIRTTASNSKTASIYQLMGFTTEIATSSDCIYKLIKEI